MSMGIDIFSFCHNLQVHCTFIPSWNINQSRHKGCYDVFVKNWKVTNADVCHFMFKEVLNKQYKKFLSLVFKFCVHFILGFTSRTPIHVDYDMNLFLY